MLDRAGDADRDVNFGSDDLARLADLIIIGDIASIHRSAACAYACAEFVGKRQIVAAKVSASLSARPPETMILADVSSGRSCLAISADTKLEMPASPLPETASIFAEPPEASAFAKAVPRTVMIFLASDDCTVAIALPA